MVSPWIQTYRGVKFDVLDPKPELVDPLDIAHALSQLCRFTGHTKVFYSVAQHSLLVAEPFPARTPEYRLALLHDATEAYLADVARPVKGLLAPNYHELEHRLLRTILERFCVEFDHDAWEKVKVEDSRLLATEARDLFDAPPIEEWTAGLPSLRQKILPMTPAEAEYDFLWAGAREDLWPCQLAEGIEI